MGDAVVDRLVKHLSQLNGGDAPSHYGLWSGWGDLHAGSNTAYDFVDACPSINWWGGREMWLFDGPVSSARSIGAVSPWSEDEIRRRGPQWWWTGRRDWFVATEIDYPWSYVGGPTALVDAILVDDALETVEVEFSDDW